MIADTILNNATEENTEARKFDRFRLGWRTRPRITAEGKIDYERIPLTSYDILHPQEGDFRVHNDEHRLFCRYLDNVVSAQVSHIPGAIVLHDTRTRRRNSPFTQRCNVEELRVHGATIT